MRKQQVHVSLVPAAVVLLTAAAAFSGEEPSGGFGIGPGMVLVENLVPGGPEINVAERGIALEVFNGTEKQEFFTVKVVKPREAIGRWEFGYEEIPDASWCRLDKEEVEVPAKSSKPISLFVKIPDKPEYFNRKWMVVVVCSPGKSKQGVVGLRVASRIQIETVASLAGEGANAGKIGLTPSICAITGTPPGISLRYPAKIRNNSDAERTFTLKKITDVVPENGKHDRYFGTGYLPVVASSWVNPSESKFTLKAGETKTVSFSINVASDALRGKRYEELVFVQDDAGNTDFIRVRVEIAPEQK